MRLCFIWTCLQSAGRAPRTRGSTPAESWGLVWLQRVPSVHPQRSNACPLKAKVTKIGVTTSLELLSFAGICQGAQQLLGPEETSSLDMSSVQTRGQWGLSPSDVLASALVGEQTRWPPQISPLALFVLVSAWSPFVARIDRRRWDQSQCSHQHCHSHSHSVLPKAG